MEDKILKKIQNDLKSTKNPVVINNNDNLSKNKDNSSKNKDTNKKSRFIDEISDSEDDDNENNNENEEDNGNYELKDEFREKVVSYVKSDDKIRELQKLVKEQQKLKKDSEEAILRHLERLGESMINISGGKIRKNQYESKGALKKEFIFYSSAPSINSYFNPDSPLTYKSDYFINMKNLTLLNCLTWMHNAGQYNNLLKNDNKNLRDLNSLTDKLSNIFNNFNPETKINKKKINKILLKKINLCKNNLIQTDILSEHKKFLLEVKLLFKNLEKKDINKTKVFLDKCKILFKKSSGLGNNYYIYQKK